MRCASAIALVMLALASGCGGDERGDRQRERAEAYSRAVERVTDTVYEDGSTALSTLNRLGDGKLGARSGGARLERLSRRVATARARLKRLRPPLPARSSAGELADLMGDLSLAMRSAAIDVRGTTRGFGRLGDVARSNARVVLARQTGASALSRAVRSLAIESAH